MPVLPQDHSLGLIFQGRFRSATALVVQICRVTIIWEKPRDPGRSKAVATPTCLTDEQQPVSALPGRELSYNRISLGSCYDNHTAFSLTTTHVADEVATRLER